MTFKQAFCSMGITEFDKPLKGLNEKEEFSTLVNWALNKLPPFHSMDLRYKVIDELYQIVISKCEKGMRIGKPMLKTSVKGAIRYDWPEEVTYETLSVDIITASMLRADIINWAKKEGRLLTAQQLSQLADNEGPCDWDYEQPVENSQVKLVQTERNCWDVVLTEEERNLLGEFLEV